jgi:hypothetical protein
LAFPVAALVLAALDACGGGGGLTPSVNTRPGTPIGSGPNEYALDVSSMSAWLAGQQRPDGAILYSATEVSPYFGNLAATGWLSDPTAVPHVDAWMRWYLAHLNSTDVWGLGSTIYEYTIKTDGSLQSMQSVDATDSAASTFLTLARKAYDSQSADAQALVTSSRAQLESIASVLTRSQDADGLTVARPDYPVEYLMDNSETYRGLSDLAYLESTAFANQTAAQWYAARAAAVAAGVAGLWNASTQTYDVANQGSTITPALLQTFAPDAASQLFPIVNGAVSPTDPHAQTVYAAFNRNYPDWDALSIPDEFPWAVLAVAAETMSDDARATAYVAAVQQRFVPTGFAWPWYCAEAGWYMRASATLAHT